MSGVDGVLYFKNSKGFFRKKPTQERMRQLFSLKHYRNPNIFYNFAPVYNHSKE
jgi:NAD-dependent SIR2 family protein deacetylase